MNRESFEKNCFTIAVDMDDTIEDLLPAWVNWLDKKHNLSVSTEDVKSWNMKDTFTTLSSDEIYEPLVDESFWYTVTPKDDAITYLKKLIEDGHDIYIATSSHPETIRYKVNAIIERYFPFIDLKHIITISKKQLLKCDIMIDDGPHNLCGGDYFKILMDAPHNKTFDEQQHGIKRVYNWAEVYDIIKNLVMPILRK